MRTKSAQAEAVLSNPSHSARAIVTVYDAGGSPVELTESGLLGIVDPVIDVEISHDVDSPRTARVKVQRQQGRYSLAPLVTTGNPLSSSVVQIARRIVIEVQLLPADVKYTPAGLRETVFDGYIDEVSWPGDDLELTCTDKWALLRDTWIERERVYGAAQGINATKGCYVWRYDLPALAVGDLVIPSDSNLNGHFYKVTAATSPQSSAEPTWPTGSGSTVVSGGVTLTEAGATAGDTGLALESLIQQVLNDNGLGSLVTLQCPSSPSWMVKQYLQQRESVQSALQTMVDQLGWWIRFEWNSGLGKYELTLKDPGRTSSTVHKTLNEADEVECSQLSLDVWSIRNAVRVVYGDSSSRSPSLSPTRIAIDVTDSASIAAYGRRFMEIAEADTSSIDSASEATRLANAVLSDLSTPVVGVGVSFAVDPYLELGDRITIPADGLRWTADQTLAVQSLTHRIGDDGARTSVTLRGTPAARQSGWLMKDGRLTPDDVHQLSVSNQLECTFEIKPTVGGTRFSRKEKRSKTQLNQQAELHVGSSSSFTPSSSSLKGIAQSDSIELSDLVPGKAYFAKWVPVSANAERLVRGEASAAIAFTAGRAKAGHYDATSTQSHLPLNGNFEHFSDDSTQAPPDHWAVVTRPAETTETWGSGGSVYFGTDSATKGNYIELRASATQRGNLVSSAFEVRRGLRSLNIYLSIMRTGSSAVSGKDLILDVSLYSDSALSNLVRSDSIFLSGSASGPYPSLSTWYDTVVDYGGGYGALPTNANFAVLGLRRGTTGDSSFAWRIGDVYAQEADFYRASIDQPPWAAVAGGVGFAANWGNVGGSWQTVGYLKDSRGFVELRGLAKVTTGTLTTQIFTLPSGYRPAAFIQYPVRTGTNVLSYLEIRTDGTVHYAGSGGGVLADAQSGITLDGVHFDTR